jgi:hypothetical protein
VAWGSHPQDGSLFGTFARRYDASGQPRSGEFQVNSHTTNGQYDPAIASDPSGNFVVAWHSIAQDGSGPGVFAQRFGGMLPAALAVDPTAGAATNGNGVLEPNELDVEVRPSWRNVNGALQGIAGVLSGIVGPAGGTHVITDSAAGYGGIPNDTTAPCTDCYRVSVTTPARPTLHWDAFAAETIVPDVHGQTKSWTLHVGESFTDVPRSNPFYRFVETLLHHGVTGGCGGTTYCPVSSTTRGEMAVFVLVGKEGAGFAPPACTAAPFPDVPVSGGFCPWIAEVARRGVVAGCGGGNYCPTGAVARQEMAVFALATLDPTFTPPPCTVPPFPDVAVGSPFCPHIAELQRRGVVGGCGGGNYCPASPVTRQEMAVFIGATFGLTLYGP